MDLRVSVKQSKRYAAAADALDSGIAGLVCIRAEIIQVLKQVDPNMVVQGNLRLVVR